MADGAPPPPRRRSRRVQQAVPYLVIRSQLGEVILEPGHTQRTNEYP